MQLAACASALLACRNFLDDVNKELAQPDNDFSMEWSSQLPPRESETCRVSIPVHLRQEWPIGTKSIGHLLRDNYQQLVTVPMQFGLTAASFSWVSWPRTIGPRATELTHVQQAYSSWLSAHPPFKWQGLVDACASGRLGTSTSLRCTPAVDMFASRPR